MNSRARQRSGTAAGGRGETASSRPVAAGHARRFPVVTLLASAIALVLSLPALAPIAELSRSGIASGEVWRLVTGHLTHWSPEHFAWDVAAFAVLGSLVERRGRRHLVALSLTAALAISATLLLLHPGLELYRGLSGLDAALFTSATVAMGIGGLRGCRFGDALLAAGLLIGFAAKLGFEAVTGAALFVSGTGAVAVVPAAHVVGAAVGAIHGVWPSAGRIRRSADPAGPEVVPGAILAP